MPDTNNIPVTQLNLTDRSISSIIDALHLLSSQKVNEPHRDEILDLAQEIRDQASENDPDWLQSTPTILA